MIIYRKIHVQSIQLKYLKNLKGFPQSDLFSNIFTPKIGNVSKKK